MRKLAKIAAATALALPLMGMTASAQAADITFGVTAGTYDPDYVRYDDGYYRSGYHAYGERYRALPPRVVRSYLRQSYREVSMLDRRGDVYVARAEDMRGRDLRITASAYTGQVIDVDYVSNGDRWDDRRDRKVEKRLNWLDDHDGYDRDGDGRDKDRFYSR
ncbi:MAG: hypothetical protein IT548_09390 [Alphaproteobacteria bacterium]|nr:hypothetical protein [Alphaproteobacteria bacterium]